MKKIIFNILLLLITFSASAQKNLDQTLKKHNKNNVPYISVTELSMLQSQENVLILDSRELKEFTVSHIETATNIGYDYFSIEDFLEKHPNKKEVIVVYCTLGIRSETIADQLIKSGYSNVKNLYGGICEWKNKKFKVLDSTETETKNVHTFNKEWSKWLKKGTPVF
ncbi:MAG: rhodanese-like domain-containing protein [Flavobacteriaceae bacterium]|nr:rhodanese-like domain-containing protein [Flavobacteriaceae bacterium]